MFIVALFTVAKKWKPLKCASIDDWIKNMWYICIYNGIPLRHKKRRKTAICGKWMDLEDIVLREISHT